MIPVQDAKFPWPKMSKHKTNNIITNSIKTLKKEKIVMMVAWRQNSLDVADPEITVTAV